jgi:hypothetical protein
MEKNWMKAFGAMVMAVSLFAAAPAAAQEAFGDWDMNDDAGLDNEEFATGFGRTGVYDEWDADDDGALTEDEFNAGVYGGYDDDEDGRIEEPEFGDVGDDIGDGGLFDI